MDALLLDVLALYLFPENGVVSLYVLFAFFCYRVHFPGPAAFGLLLTSQEAFFLQTVEEGV